MYKVRAYRHGGFKMGELYTELLVKRKAGVKEKLIKILLIVLVILSIPTVVMYRFGLLLVVAAIAITVFVFIRTDIEYEYLYYNGEIDIDIIYRKAYRKNIFSVNVSEMEMLAPVNSIEVKHYERLKTVDYSSGTKNGNKYVMVIAKSGQKIRMIFEPNEKMIEDLFYRAPRKVIRK